MASDRLDCRASRLHALLTLRVVDEPALELLVERRMLGASALESHFDQALVGAQRNMLQHRVPPGAVTAVVYTAPGQRQAEPDRVRPPRGERQRRQAAMARREAGERRWAAADYWPAAAAI